MQFDDLKTALNSTGVLFKPYGWSVAPGDDYGVYALDGQGESVNADGSKTLQALEGTVDLFCHSDDLTNFNLVQEALNAGAERWYLNSIQYENDTRLIHYEWVFQVVNSVGDN